MSKTERALEEPGLSTAPDELRPPEDQPVAGSEEETLGDPDPYGRPPSMSFPAPSLADAAGGSDEAEGSADGADGATETSEADEISDAVDGAEPTGLPQIVDAHDVFGAAEAGSPSPLPAPDPFAGGNGSNGHHDGDTDVAVDDQIGDASTDVDGDVEPTTAGAVGADGAVASTGDIADAALARTEQHEAVPGEALRVTSPGTEILEELRRADIDGPTVDLAPQDDTSTGVRRPQRLADYDPAPIPIPAKVPRLLGRKPRVRKVTRVVRHVDPWSVFKIAIIANMVLYVVALTSGVLLWNVAYATGTIDNVERFFESFGWNQFEFNGGQIYHSAWIAGLFLVIGLTGLAVLAATLFNLITDLVGGMRFTVLEEEVVERRTSPMRRFVVRRPEPEVPAVDRDESGAIIREAVVDDSGAIIRRSR